MIARRALAARPRQGRSRATAPPAAAPHRGDPPMIARPADRAPQPFPEETRP